MPICGITAANCAGLSTGLITICGTRPPTRRWRSIMACWMCCSNRRENKLALQRELGLWQDAGKFVIGLISRLTTKGLDLVNAIIAQVMDGNTQVIVPALATSSTKTRSVTMKIHTRACSAPAFSMTNRSHRIYAGSDSLFVPSRFEPCGLTQLNDMHYGGLPIVRETGGLKDTVEPYNDQTGGGNGFTFDRYDAGLLLDAINRAKMAYFTNCYHWDEVVTAQHG